MQFDSKYYTKLIVKAYEEKRDANLLSHLLIDPSTASIRQECLNVYIEKTRNNEQEEEYTLRSFFGVLPPGKNFGKVIEKYELDRFRPIQGLINGKIKNPTLANVELLAWLIDFTPRPLSRAKKAFENPYTRAGLVSPITGGDESNSNPDQIDTKAVEIKEILPIIKTENTVNISQDGEDIIPISNNAEAGNSTKDTKGSLWIERLKIAAFIVFIIAILFGGIYLWQYEKPGGITYGNVNNGCMCWVDDHYEPIDCNAEKRGRIILPLNEETMKSFKKITKEDTITEKSINVIYYLKTDNKREYFTLGGNHPIYINRPLKILSRRIYESYILKKEIPAKDSLSEPNAKIITNR